MRILTTAAELQAGIARGAFMVTGRSWPNIMTVGWGAYGIMWNRHIVMIPVRHSKLTYEILERYNEFSLCVPPANADMRSQLLFCGERSGRDFDKFKECGFTPLPAQNINSYIIKESELVYECKIIYKSELDPSGLNRDIFEASYGTGDSHTFYYGEIVKEYHMNRDQGTAVIMPPAGTD
jgi:flavin reductase (DIM6/NTAB) family NADH-FMN oxidoreductase RutF